MYKILLKDIENKYEYDELIKVFLMPEQYTLLCKSDENTEFHELSNADLKNDTYSVKYDKEFVFYGNEKNKVQRDIYKSLSELTGIYPKWGIHIGVRPIKLAGELFDKTGSEEKMLQTLKERYLFSAEKLNLTQKVLRTQRKVLPESNKNSVGVYIGIPFCPTRCLYCSFTSNQAGNGEIELYLEALKKEIIYAGRKMKETGMYPESLYMGGGTPTTLSADQLKILLDTIYSHIDISKLKEFTVEAGRPDTITLEKLKVINSAGIKRISINPQSMKDKTLELIGRAHTKSDVLRAFEMARNAGISIINTDIIAGLPEESVEDFSNTIEELIALGAENVTVHTLAVKRASKLIDLDKDFHYKQAEIVSEMLSCAENRLLKAGYHPYYLYRQKHMAGSMENTGYCKEACEGIYNIRIMDEHQTIVALGAGGISKAYFPKENRLERVPNVSNYEIYVERIDEMIKRKEENLFISRR